MIYNILEKDSTYYDIDKKNNNEAAVVGWKESDLYQYKSSFPSQIAYKKPSLELIRRKEDNNCIYVFFYLYFCMHISDGTKSMGSTITVSVNGMDTLLSSSLLMLTPVKPDILKLQLTHQHWFVYEKND